MKKILNTKKGMISIISFGLIITAFFFGNAKVNAQPCTSITTTFTGATGSAGNMFDIVAINQVTITSFDADLDPGTGTVEIWYRLGSFVGFETSSAGWIQIGTASVTSAGNGSPTAIPIAVNVIIPAGNTVAFYVTSTNNVNYTVGTALGNVYASDTNLQVLEGNGGGYFSVTFSPRVFNGVVHYICGGPTDDVGVIAIDAPTSGCNLTAAEAVTVRVYNFGSIVQSNILVSFDDGTGAVNEIITSPLNPGNTISYTFTATSNLSVPGVYLFDAWTSLAGDTNNVNDSIIGYPVNNISTISTFPYFEDFESGAGDWSAGGTNSSWAFGNPATTFIPAAASGMNAWVTNLTGPYNNSELSYLISSPCFDFTSFTSDPVISFSHIFTTESCCDEGWVEFSIDAGSIWTKLGSAASGANWYNDAGNDWWDGNSGASGVWRTAQHTLTGLAGQSNVKIRFVFSSDAFVTLEGIGVDDIFIGALPDDVGVIAIDAPTSGCNLTAVEAVTVRVKNFGTAVQSSIPVSFDDGTGVVTDTISGSLNPGDTISYIFTTTSDLSITGSYTFDAWTDLVGDANNFNDTLSNYSVINNCYCIPVYTYGCGPFGDYIDGVEFAGIDNSPAGTGCNTDPNNYIFYSGDTAKVNRGSVYPVTLTHNLANSNGFGVWIDFNADNDFADAGEFVFASLKDYSPKNGVVNIPLTATLGITRMRVRNSRYFILSDTDSCSSLYYGETEDYNILIKTQLANDVGIIAIDAPTTGCQLTAAEVVTVRVKNFGSAVQSNIPVSFDDGTGVITETITGPLNTGDTITYTFTATSNLSAPGTYFFDAWTGLVGDSNNFNDTITNYTVKNYNIISSFPYFEDFELGVGGWISGGVNSTWAFGAPAKATINSAGSGANSWVTGGLTSIYNTNENSFVESPCFDFSGLANQMIELKIWWNSESWDGAVLQSSIDGGSTWQNVGAFGDPDNWYNYNTIYGNPGGQLEGWSGSISFGGNGSGGWVIAKHPLRGLDNISSVRFRIAFGADGYGQDDGFAFDDIAIYDMPANELALSATTSFEYYLTPISQVKGYNFDGIVFNNGINNATNIGLYVDINSGIFTDTAWTTSITTGTSDTFTTTNTFVPIDTGTYNVDFGITYDSISLDGDTTNNFATGNFIISDTVYAREDGQVNTVFWGEGTFGSLFYINNADTLTSVSFFIDSKLVGDTVSVDIYNFAGTPTTIIASTPVMTITNFTWQWYTLPIISGGVLLTPGSYVIGVNIQGNTYIGFNINFATQGTAWPKSGYTGFNWEPVNWGTYMIRANFGTAPVPLNATIVNSTEATCGIADGSATVNVGGGRPPYTYSWSNGDTLPTADSLTSGIYMVIVADAAGNSVFAMVTINDAGSAAISVNSATDISCNGQSDGAIDINVTGGALPYTFLWSNGNATEDINNLFAGPYEVNVTDANGCAAFSSITLTEPDRLILVTLSADAQCGISDGSATVFESGGTSPYTYSWSTGGTDATIDSIPAGVYNVTVTDSNGCIDSTTSAVSNFGGPTIVVDSMMNAECGDTVGSIFITVTGGVGSYTYYWSNGSTTDDLVKVTAGIYEITVTDLVGCTKALSIEIQGIPLSIPSVCVVTADSATGKNVIVWEKSPGPGILAYNIYRESTMADVYFLIGTVPYDSQSIFIDTLSNPLQRAYWYKIAVIDSCGESDLSTKHKTMHLTINEGLGNINLIWDRYEGFNYGTYYIYRYTTITGWEKFDSLSSNSISYTDFLPPFVDLFYQIAVQHPVGCNPALTKTLQYNSAKSNVTNRLVPTGINHQSSISNLQFKVYPNPYTGKTAITYTLTQTFKVTLEVYNVLGKKIQVLVNEPQNIGKYQIDFSANDPGYSPGVYILKLRVGDELYMKKLVEF